MAEWRKFEEWGRDGVFFLPVLCLYGVAETTKFQMWKKKKHFPLTLPADWRRSCSQHGCEIARAENFTTFLRTSVSLWLCVRLCRCTLFVCGPYKDMRVTCVDKVIGCNVCNTRRINWVTVKAAWLRKTSRLWSCKALWSLIRLLDTVGRDMTPVYRFLCLYASVSLCECLALCPLTWHT